MPLSDLNFITDFIRVEQLEGVQFEYRVRYSGRVELNGLGLGVGLGIGVGFGSILGLGRVYRGRDRGWV